MVLKYGNCLGGGLFLCVCTIFKFACTVTLIVRTFTFANSSVLCLLPFDLCALLLSLLFTPFSIFSDHNKSYTTTAALTVNFY